MEAVERCYLSGRPTTGIQDSYVIDKYWLGR